MIAPYLSPAVSPVRGGPGNRPRGARAPLPPHAAGQLAEIQEAAGSLPAAVNAVSDRFAAGRQ